MNKLTVLNHNNERVLTTKQLAEVYETEEANIKMNISRNKERFIEGKHYYKLTGEELKDFKNLVTDSYLVNKRTPSLILWTEKGASRMCKILDTDKAWEQFDILEETYFRVKDVIQEKMLNEYRNTFEIQNKEIQELKELNSKNLEKIEQLILCVGIRDRQTKMYTNYIKNRLGIENVNSDYYKIRKALFRYFGVDKWEDLSISDKDNILTYIDKLLDAVETCHQLCMF